MKTLVFTDLHLHDYKKFGQDDSLSLPKRLKEQEEVLDQIWENIVSRGVELCVFGGDWFHHDRSIPTECLNVTSRFFNRFNDSEVSFEAVRGNHDLTNKSILTPYSYSLAPFIGGINNYKKLPKSLYLLHYDEVVDYSKIVGYDLVVAHKMPIGSQAHGYVFDEGVDWQTLSKNNKVVLWGHNHTRQALAKNSIVMGCPMPLTFGHSGEHGFYIVENGVVDFFPLKSPQFLTISEGKVPSNDGNYYRVIGDVEFTKASNIIAIKEPEYFESKIKSNSFVAILREWITINNKEQSYLEPIKELIDGDLLSLKHLPRLILKEVSIEDFLSFGKSSFEVVNGLTVISGKSDNFDSNGSGKSSTCEAIFWALFGATTKGLTGDDVIRKYPKQQKDCSVSLLIQGQTCDYKVERTRKTGLSVYKRDHGVDAWYNLTEGLKQKESQAILDGILGFDAMTFASSSYFSQEQLFLLTRLGGAEKNGIITQLLGFSSYDKLLEQVTTKSKSLESQKLSVVSSVQESTMRSEFLLKEKSSLSETEKTILTRAKDKKDSLSKEIQVRDNLLGKLSTIKEVVIDTSELDVDRFNLEEDLYQIENELSALEFKKPSLQRYKEEKASLDKSILEVSLEKNSYSNQLASLTKELNKLSSIEVGKTCSYCGSIVTSSHNDEEKENLSVKIAEVSRLLNEKEQQLDLTTPLKDDLEKSISSFEKDLSLAMSKKSLKEVELRTIVSNIQKIKENKGEEDIIKSSIKGSERLIASLNSELSQLKVDYTNNKTKVEINSSDIEHNLNLLHENNYLLEATTKDLSILAFWKEALGFKGVKSLLLDGFCNSFNAILKNYIAEVSDGSIFCQFSPVSQTKSGELRNKLDLILELGGLPRQYESLSGGEKRRVDIAVCLAFSEWVQNHHNLDTSLLGVQIFDEIFHSLDSSGEDTVAPLLRKLSSNKAIMVISHGKELGSYADRALLVTKIDNISTIKAISV